MVLRDTETQRRPEPKRPQRDRHGFQAGWRELFQGDAAWLAEWERRAAERMARRTCSRCVYDEDTPGIQFDGAGVCNYCATHDGLAAAHPTGNEGWRRLKEIAAVIRAEGRKKPCDVIVGVSGGCDSSYMLHLARELDLRPQAVHFDNTWGSNIAVENIRNVLRELSVELWTYVVDNEEYDDLYRSFLEAGVPDLDIPTDIGLATVLNTACDKFGVRYIFEGHSFRTEGVSPLGWWYMDSRYIESVQRQYGTRPIDSFPHLWLWKQLRWMLVRRLKKVRPLYFIDYVKEDAKRLLTDRYGWKWYGGHHLENWMTAFTLHYFQPRRFGIDQRANGFAALVRSGQLARDEALAMLREPPLCDPEITELVKKRLGLSEDKWVEVMTRPIRTYREFRTYKPTFERMRPFFYVMATLGLVPMSFYLKYTSKHEI